MVQELINEVIEYKKVLIKKDKLYINIMINMDIK